MFFRLALCALFAFSLQTPAMAQDTTEAAARIQAAITLARAGDLDGAAAEVERGIAAAETATDRFNTLYVLAQIRQNQGRHRLAAELGERAANLVRTEAPDDLESLNLALQLAAQAYYEAQDRDAWFRVTQERRVLTDIELAVYWRDLDGTPEHVFTAAHCPIRLGSAVRAFITNLNATGTDEECQYSFAEIPAPRITVFMTRITTMDSLDALYESTQQQINVAFGNPRRISYDLLDFNGLPVRRAIFAQGTTRTGVWLSLVQGWSLKLRLTHAGEVTDEAVDAVASALFSDLSGIDAHLSQCAALADRSEAGTVIPTLIDALMLQSLFEAAVPGAEHQCFLALPEFNDGLANIAWSELDEAGLVQRYVAGGRGPNSPYRVILARSTLPTLHGGSEFVLASENEDGMFLLGGFDSLPSPEQFIEQAELAAAGQLTSYAQVTLDEEGNSQISLNSALMDATSVLAEPQLPAESEPPQD